MIMVKILVSVFFLLMFLYSMIFSLLCIMGVKMNETSEKVSFGIAWPWISLFILGIIARVLLNVISLWV